MFNLNDLLRRHQNKDQQITEPEPLYLSNLQDSETLPQDEGLSPTAARVAEGLPRLISKYQGANSQLGMMTGMLQGIMMSLLPKVPEDALRNQLIEVRDEMSLWIGYDEEPVEVIPYHMEYDTSYDVPGLKIVETEIERRESETGRDGETDGSTPDDEPASAS